MYGRQKCWEIEEIRPKMGRNERFEAINHDICGKLWHFEVFLTMHRPFEIVGLAVFSWKTRYFRWKYA